MMELLQREQRLLQVVKLVGADVLPLRQRLILETCSIFKNMFLQQNAFDDVDTYCSPERQFLMLKTIVKFYQKSEELVKKGVNILEIKAGSAYKELIRMRFKYSEKELDGLKQLSENIEKLLQELEF